MLLQTIPVLSIGEMETSLQFYMDQLDFEMISVQLDGGKIRKCLLQRDGVSVILRETSNDFPLAKVSPREKSAQVAIYFVCENAMTVYHQLHSRGVTMSKPLQNNSYCTFTLQDPNGYLIKFKSETVS